jgi:hypothetical protein
MFDRNAADIVSRFLNNEPSAYSREYAEYSREYPAYSRECGAYTSPPYEVSQKGDPVVLGQKTVFPDTVLLPRSLVVLPIIDAGIYHVAVANAERSFKQAEERKLRQMRGIIADAYESREKTLIHPPEEVGEASGSSAFPMRLIFNHTS